eukprot:gene8041-5788_t
MSYGLNGTLPTSIGNLSALSVMNVAYNYLYGTIPSSILTPAALSALYLDNNRFSGSLPRGTATGCQRLQHYSTGNNKFARIIPTTWTSWYLNLSVNRIVGSLPYQLQSLGKLQTLDASENKLAGTLPRYLNALTSLRTLVLQFNKIGGSIPAEITQLQRIAESVATLRTASVTLMSHGLRDVVLATQRLHQSLAGCVAWALAVLTPMYAWLSARYGVYGDSFIWAVSMGYSWWLLTLPRVWRPRGAAEIQRLVAAASAATEREGDAVQRQENPLWRGAAAASVDCARSSRRSSRPHLRRDGVRRQRRGRRPVAFGVAFPLIAAAGAVAIAADTLVLQLVATQGTSPPPSRCRPLRVALAGGRLPVSVVCVSGTS